MNGKAIVKDDVSYEITAQNIMTVRVLTATTNTLEAAQQSIAILQDLSGGIRRPLLIDLLRAGDMDAAARQLYVSSAPIYATRVALLSNNVLTRVVGNFFIGVMATGRDPVPTHLFENEKSAVEWLLKQS